MISKFRAAVLVSSKRELAIQEISFVGNLKPGQVLVKLKYSGLCGAQINEIDAVKGQDKFLPHLLGHEGVGQVVEIGDLVNHVSIGDKVILHWMQGIGIQSQLPEYINYRGEIINAGWVTTFNEYAVVSANRCTKIRTTVEDKFLPPLGCSATTALGVVNNDAQIKVGDTALVIGCGGVGLLTVASLSLAGALEIIALDINSEKLTQAKKFGSTLGLNAQDVDCKKLLKTIDEYLNGRKIDAIIETTGNKEMIEFAYDLARDGGKVILVGVPNVAEPISIDSLPLHFNTILKGSKGGDSSPQVDIDRILRLTEMGRFPLTDFPIKIFKLDEINEAIAKLRSGTLGRMIIEF